MGISDDIKPRKKIVEVDTIHPLDKDSNFDLSGFLTKETNDLSDDFFQNKKKPESKELPEQYDEDGTVTKHNHKSFDKKYLWLLIIPILAFFIYQNYQDIKSTLKKTPATNSNSNTNKAYTGEIIPQDYTNTNTNINENTNTVVEAPANTNATTETTPTTTEIAKSSIKIRVLNGNGISKSGQTIKTELTNAGFTVSNIGNAGNFAYTDTKVYYKTGKEQQAQMVKDALVSKVGVLTLSDSTAGIYDVVVVVGKN